MQLADLVVTKGLPHPAGIKYTGPKNAPKQTVSHSNMRAVMAQIAYAHLPRGNYRSGFNSQPPRRVQAFFDARQTYPKQDFGVLSTTAQVPFNDTKTPYFVTAGQHTGIETWKMIMFPEMIPAVQFSGSMNYDTIGDTKRESRPKVLRDLNRTPFRERIVAPGAVRSGLEHKATALLNQYDQQTGKISQNTDALGGTIEPFDDSRVNTDAFVINAPAMPEGILPGFDQKIGDLIAIVIPLTPSKDTTIGIDRNNPDRINTSMAYYNFSSSEWETSGSHKTTVYPFNGGGPGTLTDFTWVVPGVSGSKNPSWAFYQQLGYGANMFGDCETSIGCNTGGVVRIQNSSSLRAGWGPGGYVNDGTDPNAWNSNNLSYATFNNHTTNFVQLSASLGFGGTSGFTIYPDNDKDCLSTLATRARPTSQCGFPLDDKYAAKDSQLLDMSKYIDRPFLLERFAIHFDAEIEDSGPYSLGYKLHNKNGNEAFTGMFDDKTADAADAALRSVSKGHNKNSTVFTSPASPYLGSGIGQSVGRTTFSRGQILGGNHPAQRIARNQYLTASVLVSRLEKFPMGYTSASHAPTVFGAVIGADGFGGPNNIGNYSPTNANSAGGLNWNGYYTWGSFADARAWMATPGLFLPVSGSDHQRSVYGASYPDVGGYIPVLPAGVNGLVTGSQHALTDLGNTDAPLPYLPLPTHDHDRNIDGTTVDNGAPFWRCDTFFLLRQEEISKPIKRFLYPESSNWLHSPMIENRCFTATVEAYSTHWGEDAAGNSNNTMSVQMRAHDKNVMWGPRPAGIIDLIDGLVAGGVTAEVRKGFRKMFPTALTASATTSRRELVSYGQMVHYGYCTAPANLEIDQDVTAQNTSSSPTLCFTQGIKYSHTGTIGVLPLWIGDNGHHGGELASN